MSTNSKALAEVAINSEMRKHKGSTTLQTDIQHGKETGQYANTRIRKGQMWGHRHEKGVEMETHCSCSIAGAYPTPQEGQPGSRKSWACMAAGGPEVRKAGQGITALLEARCENASQARAS